MKKFNLQYNLEAIIRFYSFSFGKKVSGIRLGIYKSSVFLMLLLLFFVTLYIERAGWHDNYCYSSSFINFYS